MAEPTSRNQWRGIDNRQSDRATSAGYVKDAVNVDVTSGTFSLRTGFHKRVAGTAARGALATGNQVVFADGADLKCYDVRTDSVSTLGTIDPSGRLAGTLFNDELFLCSETHVLRFDGHTLRPWGVPTALAQPVPALDAGGGFVPGNYQVAITFVDALGYEGATSTPLLVSVAQPCTMRFELPAPPAGGSVRLYISQLNGSELYLQADTAQTDVIVAVPADDTARLESTNLRAPIPGQYLAPVGGCILIADGKTLWFTMPMRPHLIDMATGFFQYAAPITVVATAETGVYVCADRTYFVTGTATDSPTQREVLPYGGLEGTAVSLPDGNCAWMTRYGLAVGDPSGTVRLLSAERFAPALASRGASGMLEHNGNQLVVTSLEDRKGDNPLAARDSYKARIVTP